MTLAFLLAADLPADHDENDARAGQRAISRADRSRSAVSSDDAQIASRIRAGDPHALEALFREHVVGLTRFAAQYVKSNALAEEIVQDIFLALWRGRATWSPSGSVAAYLYSAARNRAHNVHKHDRIVARHAAQLAPENGVTTLADPGAEFEANELARRLDTAIASLAPRTREVYLLYRDAGLSYQAIAEALGISVNTVYVQIGRAVAALQKVIDSGDR